VALGVRSRSDVSPGNRRGAQQTVQPNRARRRADWHRENNWSPNQLRHTAAFETRQRFGLDAAQVQLGHATRRMTERYAKPDYGWAERVASETG